MTAILIAAALMRRRNNAVLLGVALTTLVFLGTISVAWFGGYRINLTPSEPLGLWRMVKLARPVTVGDLVFVCPPQTATMREARARGYLRSGLCPGGAAPLIKSVIAIPGQRVEVDANVSVDGHTIPSSGVAQFDGQGRKMTRFAGGSVPGGSVFLHSPFAGSYDSRYFGPIPEEAILGLAQEVLTYAP
ncbi:conjugative transfer signal peptidase TraF [Ensifer sp. 2YAB10]|jgi:conjugative transfer signal peptidase TraF|uniref:conjugative transfer signal peptidase TraF n=1 Tax=unclassified Ensifer TaxID=2633371 RepID=UPI001A421335|nr:conjugative transfer signal peptidase TraF [Ensifer sp. SSB1]MBK5570754.1 conjugative transfer signal peptidase TraF [Ensifer sp. SSB1]